MAKPSTLRLPKDVEAAIDAAIEKNKRYGSRTAFLVEAARRLLVEEDGPKNEKRDMVGISPRIIWFGVAASSHKTDTSSGEDLFSAVVRRVVRRLGVICLRVSDGCSVYQTVPSLGSYRVSNLYADIILADEGVVPMVGRLHIGGGADLLPLHGDVDMQLLAWDRLEEARGPRDDSYRATPGLRDHPILIHPNHCEIELIALGPKEGKVWLRVGIVAVPVVTPLTSFHDVDRVP